MTEPQRSAGAAPDSIAARLWAVAALALLLRVLEAAESSLWLDELHTLSHASQPTLRAVVDSVGAEYHTPLFFGFVHLFGGFELGAWLRAIPIVSSVALLPLVVAVARECGLGARATLAAAWLYACLPYQVLYGTELRPYAWIGGFSVLAFLLAFSERRSTLARLALFFASILLGLLTHRLMALGLFSIGCARLLSRKPGSVPLPALVLSGTLAVAGFLPWLLGFAADATGKRFDYQESVGGYHLSKRLVLELVALPARLVTPAMNELGGAWAAVELAATAGFGLVLAALLLRAWLRRAGAPPRPVLRGLWTFTIVQFLATTGFAWWTWDRVPLQYYTPMAWAIPVLAAACLERLSDAASRRAAFALCATSLAMAAAFVGGKSREDMRGGVAAVRALASAAREATGLEPVATAVVAQPTQFPHTLPYRAYGPDLGALEPESVARPGDADFARPVIVLRRVVPFGDEVWAPITDGRELVREIRVDFYLRAYWFAPKP